MRNLEPEDLAALTVEAAAMAGVPLAGTNWVPGRLKRRCRVLTTSARGAAMTTALILSLSDSGC